MKLLPPFVSKVILILASIGIASILFFAFRPQLVTPPPFISPTSTLAPTSNLTITEPAINAEVGYLITIKGQARVFENQFQWRIKDFKGNILASGISSSNATDSGQYGNYLITTTYQLPKSSTGFVEVYDSSAKDGSEQDNQLIPIRFPQGEFQQIQIHLLKYSPDSSQKACITTYPVARRIPKTVSVAQTAIGQLLLGPTTTETLQGYVSHIKSGTFLNSLNIKDGVATADFNSVLLQGSDGSCSTSLLLKQIENTLLQFSTVKKVVITVDNHAV